MMAQTVPMMATRWRYETRRPSDAGVVSAGGSNCSFRAGWGSGRKYARAEHLLKQFSTSNMDQPV